MVDVEHDDRFSPPISNATRVHAYTWKREPFVEGDRVAYSTTDYSKRDRDGNGRTVRHEGVIVELWLELWRGTEEMLYAEIESADGVPERAWFHRDHVGTPGTLGQPGAGMLL